MLAGRSVGFEKETPVVCRAIPARTPVPKRSYVDLEVSWAAFEVAATRRSIWRFAQPAMEVAIAFIFKLPSLWSPWIW